MKRRGPWTKRLADSDGRVVRVGHGQYKWVPWPTYEEWLRAAADEPNQNDVWRVHELIARSHREHEDPAWIDIGGEA